jgi:hypothetical protein
MSSFEIPDGPTTVELKSQSVKGKALRTATVTFTVTNRTVSRLACRLKAAPQGDAMADWFEIQGEKERLFAASETQKVTINITVPVEVSSSDIKFRLQAMNVNDPGNDYAESAVATLALPNVKRPDVVVDPKSKLWIYIAIAAALLIIVGGVAFMVHKKRPDTTTTVNVPNVVGQKPDDAKIQLTNSGFNPVVNNVIVMFGPSMGKVISQTPGAGSAAAKGSNVAISVGVMEHIVIPPKVVVPHELELVKPIK